MKEAKLINCPFCDGEAEIDCDDHFSNWFVRCTKCFCKTPKHTTEFFAKVCWNTRKPMERILEKLDKRIEHHVKLVNYEMNMGTIVDVERHEEAIKATDKAIEIVKEEGGIE